MQRLRTELPERVWIIGINDSLWPFTTSDNPVVQVSADASNPVPLGKTGYCWSGEQIALPLDPEVILMIFERECFRALPGSPPPMSLYDLEGSAIDLPDSHVLMYNWLQINGSELRLFSRVEEFDLSTPLHEV
jgi:Protein of unknown function (DUF4238)